MLTSPLLINKLLVWCYISTTSSYYTLPAVKRQRQISENDAPSATKINILHQHESAMRQAPSGGDIMNPNSRNVESPVHI